MDSEQNEVVIKTWRGLANVELIHRNVIYWQASRQGFQDADNLDLVQLVLVRVSSASHRWEPSATCPSILSFAEKYRLQFEYHCLFDSSKDRATLSGFDIQGGISKNPNQIWKETGIGLFSRAISSGDSICAWRNQ